MDGKSFKLEIITPRKVVFSADVTSFTAPGEVGSFQVLVDHADLLSAVIPGEVKFIDVQGAEQRYATSGGFVEVKDNHVVMLADTVEQIHEIDVARAQQALERAQKRLSERAPETNLQRARKALERAQNRLRLAGRT